MNAIKTVKLSKKYGNIFALENTNLEIRQNSVYGLVGPNGSGKTTTLLLISGLIRPTEGKIYINNLDTLRNSDCANSLLQLVSKQSEFLACSRTRHGLQPVVLDIKKESSKIKNIIGIMPQNADFYRNMTAYEHMVFYSKLNGMEKEDAKKNAKELLEAVGLAEQMNKKVGHFSTGMTRMLSFAQAFAGSPKIILLDEPLEGLDPVSSARLIDIIKKYNKNHNATFVISSHYLEKIEKICSDIGILNQGKLILQDSLSNLRKSRNSIRIELEKENKKIAEILKKIKFVRNINIDDRALIIKTSKDISDEILGLILKNKIKINKFEVGKTLEDIFIEKI